MLRLLHVRLTRLGLLVFVALATMTVLAPFAGAQEVVLANGDATPLDVVVDPWTLVILSAAGALIRPVTAWLTTASADDGPLGAFLGVVLAGVTAGGAAITGLGDVGADPGTVFTAFALAFTAAAVANANLWAGRAVAWIHEKTDDFIRSIFGSTTS
jgi:hypothetical protein